MVNHSEELHCANCAMLLMTCKFVEFAVDPKFMFCCRECADEAKVVEEIRERINRKRYPPMEVSEKPEEWTEMIEIAEE
jgi:hypothetical protein